MSQLSYGADFEAAYPGMPADSYPMDVVSGIAVEACSFGRAGMRSDDSAKPNSVRVAKRNAPVIVWSGDFVTSNVINGVVNGVAISPITFATDHLTTITALGAEIVAKLLAQGIVATVALSGTNRTMTFTVTDANVDFTNFVVTAGSGQVTATLTAPTSDAVADFVGVLLHENQPPRQADGLNGYAAKDSVGLVRKGRIWVEITSDVADNADAYIDRASGAEGKFTDVSTSNIGPVGKFRGAAVASGLSIAVLEVNLP
jgi:hypothetical protein